MNIKLKPFMTPNFVMAELPARPSVEGRTEALSFKLCDIEAQELSDMCDAFRFEVFLKANKRDPKVKP